MENVEEAANPLLTERRKLDECLESLQGAAANDPAMMLVARNALVSLGGMARFGATAGEMAYCVQRTGDTVARFLDKDPGEALAYPLLDARAAALTEAIRHRGDIAKMEADDKESWTEESFELFAIRDAADAWLLGTAALLRFFQPGQRKTTLERVRERTVHGIARFDRALEPALPGLSVLREAAKNAVLRARTDKGYVRRAFYWARIIEG